MKCILLFSPFFVIVGCFGHEYSCQIEENMNLDTKKDSEYNLNDPELLLRKNYPYLFVVPVCPDEICIHTKKLMSAKAMEEIAYHIIAIGILKEETPEAIEALNYIRFKYGGEPVPSHFDWPDLVEVFKQRLVENPYLTVADYPGSRGIHFNFLIDECIDRLKKNIDAKAK